MGLRFPWMRSCTAKHRVAWVWCCLGPRYAWCGPTAAGVVADSDPQAEWQETQHKARALLAAAQIATGEAT